MTHQALAEFADRINEILPVIMRGFAKKIPGEFLKGKITPPQFFILEFLYSQGESKMSDLASFMGVTTAATTGIVDRLVRDKWVARMLDSQDRRIVRIKLTGRGMDFLKKINQQRREVIINIFGKITQAERDDYLRILRRIKEVLTKDSAATRLA